MPKANVSLEDNSDVETALDRRMSVADGDAKTVVGTEASTPIVEESNFEALRGIFIQGREITGPEDLTNLVIRSDEDRSERETGSRHLRADGGRSTTTREVRVESAVGCSGDYRATEVDGSVAFDEPSEGNEKATAPTPVEHLLGALGSCLTLSVRRMAARDGVAIGQINCTVNGSPPDGPLESISVDLTMESDASDDAIDRIMTKAERACYVERALSDSLEVSVTWSASGSTKND